MAFLVNNSVLRAACKAAGYGEPESGVLHIWGARGALPWSGAPDHLSLSGGNIVNSWNDTLGLFGNHFGIWKGTVDPGLPYTLDPLNTKGCAHLNNGVWAYQVGSHKGHTALVQAAPVTVTRDGDKDGIGEPGEFTESGWFGIDVHSGSGSHVEDWSAGCQVVWDTVAYGSIWMSFLNPILAAGQETFRYWLLDGEQIADAA